MGVAGTLGFALRITAWEAKLFNRNWVHFEACALGIGKLESPVNTVTETKNTYTPHLKLLSLSSSFPSRL
jgi:hypothetical protein